MTNKEELKKYVKKHECQCEDCNCDETKKDCECEHCKCDEHNHDHCHCDDCNCEEDGCDCEGCDCDDCNCKECECEECECEDCHCEDCDCQDCECEECDCGDYENSKEQEYLQDLQRLQAEFDNYRKRNEFIVLKAKEEGVILAVEKLLPVLDSFKAAEKHMTEKELQGLFLVKEQVENALKQLGVVKIEAVNKTFNPDYHNAVIMGEEKGKESHTVLEVFQDGYMYKDKVIRHSMVKVNK